MYVATVFWFAGVLAGHYHPFSLKSVFNIKMIIFVRFQRYLKTKNTLKGLCHRVYFFCYLQYLHIFSDQNEGIIIIYFSMSNILILCSNMYVHFEVQIWLKYFLHSFIVNLYARLSWFNVNWSSAMSCQLILATLLVYIQDYIFILAYPEWKRKLDNGINSNKITIY